MGNYIRKSTLMSTEAATGLKIFGIAELK